jgi:hypothetical protein
MILSNACVALIAGSIWSCADTAERVKEFLWQPGWPICKVTIIDSEHYPTPKGIQFCTGKPRTAAPCVGDEKECALTY